jgi:hypothetical protein
MTKEAAGGPPDTLPKAASAKELLPTDSKASLKSAFDKLADALEATLGSHQNPKSDLAKGRTLPLNRASYRLRRFVPHR